MNYNLNKKKIMEAIKKEITYKNVCKQDLIYLDNSKNKIDDDGFLITSISNVFNTNIGHTITIIYEK